MKDIRRRQIAYRCPECASATLGFIGGLTAVSDMLRLRCSCGKSAMDITKAKDGKIHVSVPCALCRENHGLTVSSELVLRDEPSALPCPFAGTDIVFIADEEDMPGLLDKNAEELSRILASLDAEELSDIQPKDLAEAEIPPDHEAFSLINFLVKELEFDGKIHCPCKSGSYELRFFDEGIEVYCTSCGATYSFYAKTAASAEQYLGVDEIKLG